MTPERRDDLAETIHRDEWHGALDTLAHSRREGEIVLAIPTRGTNDYVLILNVHDDEVAECVLVTRRVDLAIARDVVLTDNSRARPSTWVVHTLTSALIPLDRLTGAVDRCDDAVLQEVLDCRYSGPSDAYAHGAQLTSDDDREWKVKHLYRSFDQKFRDPNQPKRKPRPGDLAIAFPTGRVPVTPYTDEHEQTDESDEMTSEYLDDLPDVWDDVRLFADVHSHYVFVLDVRGDGLASCVLVSRYEEWAIELDPIVSTTDRIDKHSTWVIHSMTGALIPLSRLSEPVGRFDDDVTDEVVRCRVSEPSGRYTYGRPRETFDERESDLRRLYAWFFDAYHELDTLDTPPTP